MEERCISFLAANFGYFCEDGEFTNLIISDAESVKDREAEDSIDIVDELKFQFSKYENCGEMTKLLDKKLDQLGLKTFGVFYNS